jgi:FAD-dependent oxidoreductase domain-containing protein 1
MRVDVAIIGGGAIGAAAAYFLRSHPRACRVAVIERDTSYQLASTPRASGGVRRLFSLPENIALSNYSIPFFARFDAEMAVDGERPAINFRKVGYLSSFRQRPYACSNATLRSKRRMECRSNGWSERS